MIGSLFTGIGGLDLGLERAGLGPVVYQAESDAYCRRVLARHWPEVRRFSDVREVSGVRADVICGGFPCQPVSVAGRRRAQADERWLWPLFAAQIEAQRPRAVVIENVPGLRSAGLRDVLADLASLGLDAEWSDLAACDVGAPHKRQRLFLVATDPNRVDIRDQPGWLGRSLRSACAAVNRPHLGERVAADAVRLGQQGRHGDAPAESARSAEPTGFRAESLAHAGSVRRLESAVRFAEIRGWSRVCGWSLNSAPRVHDGLPRGLVSARRRALGNAVVVRCAELVGMALRGVLERAEVAA